MIINEKRLSPYHPDMISLGKMEKILSNLLKREIDKKLAEKCGLSVHEICVHEFDMKIYCTKCGAKYDNQ